MTTEIQNRTNVGRVLAATVLVTALAAFLMLTAGPSYASTTFYVNSTSDHADVNLAVPDCDTGYTVERDGAGRKQNARSGLP